MNCAEAKVMAAKPICSVLIRALPLEVYRSQLDDVNEARIYMRSPTYRAMIENRRRVARLSYGNNRAYCEVLYADADYVKRRLKREPGDADNLIFMNGWTRHILDIGNKSGEQLSIRFEWWYGILMCIDHPQMIVVVATLASLIGLALGVLGIGLALLAFKDVMGLFYAGIALTSIAFVTLLLVVARFTKRLAGL